MNSSWRVLFSVLAILGAASSLPGSAAVRFKTEPLAPAAGSRPGFTRLAASDLGIRWTNRLSAGKYSVRQNLMNGAGVALADFDGDGRCDVFACNKEGASGLFRNLGGFRFADVADTVGASIPHLIATGVVAADVNGDGWTDLHVTSFLGPDALLLNLGGGRFTNITTRAGLVTSGGNTSSAWSDVDGDGDLDVYLCRFGVEAVLRDGGRITTRMVNGQPVVTGRFAKRVQFVGGSMVEVGEPDILFLNDGSGRFEPAAWSRFLDEDGKPLADAPPDFGLAVQIRDFDGNGTPDIYVCNDFQTPDRLWLGDGRGRFRAAPRLALRTMSFASMGVDAADLDRDGHLDFVTVEMLTRDHALHLAQGSPMAPAPVAPGDHFTRAAVPRNTLFRNRGDGTWSEVAWSAGVAMSDWSWTPIFLDVDLDGFEDLLVSNGHAHDLNSLDLSEARSSDPALRDNESVRKQLVSYPPLRNHKAAWRNLGDFRFQSMDANWGFDASEIVHGMALGDLDGDGDLDVVGNAWGGPPLVWRNDSAAPRIGVRLAGLAPNTSGIGARVRLVALGSDPATPDSSPARRPFPSIQEQEMRAGGRYLSSDQPILTFAVGPPSPFRLEISWRSGRQSRIDAVLPGNLYVVDEPSDPIAPSSSDAPPAVGAATRFTRVPMPPGFTHVESACDDFATQPLLPWRFGRMGPAATKFRHEDATVVILGGSRGGTLRAIRIEGDGSPVDIAGPKLDSLPGDVGGMTIVNRGPGRAELLATISGFESGDLRPPGLLLASHEKGRWSDFREVPLSVPWSPGPIAAADLNGDSVPELVVGGRLVPGQYPVPAGIRILRQTAATWEVDSELSAGLEHVGLVTGLALADFDGDKRTDLALACEWGPVRVFLNTASRFVDASPRLGLAGHRGLWQSLAAADFDGDGRVDLAAGNWGLNSAHQRNPEGPWRLSFGDAVGDGHLALVESYRDFRSGEFVPFRRRDTLAKGLPWLKESFPKHRDFARAGLDRLLGTHADRFRHLDVDTLESSVFWNRGGRFEREALPAAAQSTPILGLAAVDLDHDGSIDLALSQNFFAVRDEDDRLDAGIGLILENRGAGRFRALAANESGIAVYGDGRAVLAVEGGPHSVPDLLFTQNAGPALLYRGRRSPSGK